NVELVESALTQPARKKPVFDAILVEGAVQHLPLAVLGQLKEGGRIAYVQNVALRPGAQTGLGRLTIARKQSGTLTGTALGEAGVSVLPGFVAPQGVSFA